MEEIGSESNDALEVEPDSTEPQEDEQDSNSAPQQDEDSAQGGEQAEEEEQVTYIFLLNARCLFLIGILFFVDDFMISGEKKLGRVGNEGKFCYQLSKISLEPQSYKIFIFIFFIFSIYLWICKSNGIRFFWLSISQ